MKAYSFRQMKDAGIRVDNYKANEREGEFIAIKTGLKNIEIKDKKLLINGRHQQKIAQAIYDGIRKQVAANPSLLTG